MQRHAVFVLFWSVLTPRNRLMMRKLTQLGWRISVIAWDRSGDARVPAEAADCVSDWRWIRLHTSPSPWCLFANMPRLIRLVVAELASLGRVDATFLTHFFLLLVARWAPGKRVYEAAEFFVSDIANYFGPLRSLAEPLLAGIERLLLNTIDGIVTVDSSEGWLEKRYQCYGKVVQVLWNVPALEDDPDPQEVSQHLKKYTGRQVVAYVGGLLQRKGLKVIISAVRAVRDRHPNVLFVFIGTLKENQSIVDRWIDEHGVREYLILLPQMTYREMLSHLKWADIGLATYQGHRAERLVGKGGGRKVFSYMQAEVAIVAPLIGESGGLVRIFNCGVTVDTTSSTALADAICDLLVSTDERIQAAKAGRSAFEQQYNWERESKQFSQFITELVA